jgi:N-methylhydantoinase A/oxoprolinase/acetone carboxylase beta subunit
VKTKATIDIDVGGTFTDCFIAIEGKVAIGKAPAIPLKLGVACIKAAAATAKGG